MRRYAVASSYELLKRFESCSERLLSLKSIIQNYQVVDEEQLNNFLDRIVDTMKDIKLLAEDTHTHISKIEFNNNTTMERAQFLLENEIFKSKIDELKKQPINIGELKEHFGIE